MEPPVVLLKPSSKSSSAKPKPPEGSPDNQIQVDNSADDDQPGEGDKEEMSRKLCYILRHDPGEIRIGKDGYAHIHDLLIHLGEGKKGYTIDQLVDVVNWSKDARGMHRFEMKEDE